MRSLIHWIKRFAAEKREWRAMMARVRALPEDYAYVFEKIQHHMFQRSAVDGGRDMLAVQGGLLELFEAGAAEGKKVLEVTGDDVGAFCEELLRSARTYTEEWHQSLNRDVHNKLKKGSSL